MEGGRIASGANNGAKIVTQESGKFACQINSSCSLWPRFENNYHSQSSTQLESYSPPQQKQLRGHRGNGDAFSFPSSTICQHFLRIIQYQSLVLYLQNDFPTIRGLLLRLLLRKFPGVKQPRRWHVDIPCIWRIQHLNYCHNLSVCRFLSRSSVSGNPTCLCQK